MTATAAYASPETARQPVDRVLAGLALLAPAALFFPWAAVPSKLGVGFGGPRYFLHWLTRYPNLGPVNWEVLLGILCILGASLVPAALGAWRLLGGRRRAVAFALAGAAVLVYVPVLVRLDGVLVWLGVAGAPSMFSDDPVAVPQAAAGPAIRLLALVCAVGIAARVGSGRRARR